MACFLWERVGPAQVDMPPQHMHFHVPAQQGWIKTEVEELIEVRGLQKPPFGELGWVKHAICSALWFGFRPALMLPAQPGFPGNETGGAESNALPSKK